MHRSTTLRHRYPSLSKSGFRSSLDFVGMTSSISRSRSHPRIADELYALSAASRAGNLGSGIFTAFRVSSKSWESCR
jgi:hypothetical protein